MHVQRRMKIMTGKEIKYKEAIETLENLLHELETKRVEEDLLDVDRYDYIYDMLYKLQAELQEGIR